MSESITAPLLTGKILLTGYRAYTLGRPGQGNGAGAKSKSPRIGRLILPSEPPTDSRLPPRRQGSTPSSPLKNPG